jgi:hypothetical protein
MLAWPTSSWFWFELLEERAVPATLPFSSRKVAKIMYGAQPTQPPRYPTGPATELDIFRWEALSA